MKKRWYLLGMVAAAGIMTACGAQGEEDVSGEVEQLADSEAPEEQSVEGSQEDGSEPDSAESSEVSSEEESTMPDYLQGVDLTGKEVVDHPFAEVTVHDPSVIKVDGTWYVFGSHLAGAKTDDLMNWTLIDSDVKPDNVIIPNAKEEMKEAFDWAQTDTFWAPDVIQLPDGKFYMYYCNCEGSSPLSALGIAVSDNVEGPYEDLGSLTQMSTGIRELSSYLMLHLL